MSIRVAILGYGNLGRGMECAVKQNDDMELVAVFTRRDPATVKTLTDVKVYNVDQLLSMQDKIDTLKKSASSKQARIKEVDELLRMVDYYKSGKPAADKLKSIRFEKSRQKYKSEHDNELRTFYMAERKLKLHFKDGKLPITAWRREREQLEQEYRDIQTELAPLHADAKKLWAIHYNIYEVQHEQERQNTTTRQKKQEIEH